jgi:hypothetical protein
MSKFQPLFVLSCLTLTACGTARITQRSTHGGQVELSGSYMDSMGKARVRMAESCGGMFDASDFQHGVHFACSRPAEAGPQAPLVGQVATK